MDIFLGLTIFIYIAVFLLSVYIHNTLHQIKQMASTFNSLLIHRERVARELNFFVSATPGLKNSNQSSICFSIFTYSIDVTNFFKHFQSELVMLACSLA